MSHLEQQLRHTCDELAPGKYLISHDYETHRTACNNRGDAIRDTNDLSYVLLWRILSPMSPSDFRSAIKDDIHDRLISGDWHLTEMRVFVHEGVFSSFPPHMQTDVPYKTGESLAIDCWMYFTL